MPKVELNLPQELLERAEEMAIQRQVALEALLVEAVGEYVARQAHDQAERVIWQGEVYRLQLDYGKGIPHPYVVIQADELNQSRIPTTVVVAVTSNLKRASMAGNVVLEVGEAQLPKPSVVEVSKVSCVEKARFGTPMGMVSAARVQQILAGMRFVQESYFGE